MSIRLRFLAAIVALSPALAHAQEPGSPALKTVFEGEFMVGGAMNTGQFSGRNPNAEAVVLRHFNTISPENVLKWEAVHPRVDAYNFAPADAFVDFGTRNGMFVVGHTLVWHSQTPAWVFEDSAGRPLTRDALLARMRDHITTVVGRYRGRIRGWDVVNEAVAEDGTLRRSKWLEIIGEDYIEKAFEYAHAADPQAELYYNEHTAWRPAKRDGVVRLVRGLLAKGIPVKAIGMQGHYGIDYPITELIDAAFAAYGSLGVKVNISELDVDMLTNPTGRQGSDIGDPLGRVEGYNPWPTGLPIVEDHRLAKRYAEIFRVFRAHHELIDRVTFWGVGDRDSWLNGWPIPGRANYPLLFDRDYRPKTALEVVIGTRLLSPGTAATSR
jgi:endo-1,4-beta-xylanase